MANVKEEKRKEKEEQRKKEIGKRKRRENMKRSIKKWFPNFFLAVIHSILIKPLPSNITS